MPTITVCFNAKKHIEQTIKSVINQKNVEVEFDSFKSKEDSNSLKISPAKWIGLTGAIRHISSSCRYGGAFAHRNVAFEFASWISSEFKLFFINEFQRLKKCEIKSKTPGWDVSRSLSRSSWLTP